jgi:Ca2+-binding EF-hand superfamily protein
MFNYEKIKAIKDCSATQNIKIYLKNIFEDLCKAKNPEGIKLMSKQTFTNYLGISLFISDKIFDIIKSNNEGLTLTDFTTGLDIIYKGSQEESKDFVFKLFDFDNDGIIKAHDVRLILNIILSKQKIAKEILDSLIDKFFGANIFNMNFNEFTFKIEFLDSDIYFIIVYYLYENAPFDKIVLESYKNNVKRSLSDENFNTNIAEKDLLIPTKKVSDNVTYKYMSFAFESEADEETNDYDEEELSKLDSFETIKIEMPLLNVKTIGNIEEQNTKTASRSFNEIEPVKLVSKNIGSPFKKDKTGANVIEGYVYKLRKHGRKLKKYWLLLTNKDLLYYRDSEKNVLRRHHNLSCSTINPNINTCIHNGENYFSFSLAFANKAKSFYFNSKIQCEIWLEKIKQNLNYSNFYNHYRIINKIGKGSNSIVYLANDLETSEKVAVKVYKKESNIDLDSIKAELEILKCCRHQNILSNVKTFEDSLNLYIVSDYLTNLKSYVKINPILEPSVIKDVVMNISQGIGYLNDFGLSHQNLKSCYIYVDNNNESKLEIKLANFKFFNKIDLYKKSDNIDKFNDEIHATTRNIIFYLLEGKISNLELFKISAEKYLSI